MICQERQITSIARQDDVAVTGGGDHQSRIDDVSCAGAAAELAGRPGDLLAEPIGPAVLQGLGQSGRRAQADYEMVDVPVEEAHRAVADAAIVVDMVEQWLHQTG